GSLLQEHERAAGAWQAEWDGIAGTLAAAGGGASHMAEALDGIVVHPERMRANLEATRGLIMSERLVFALAEHLGREDAHTLVREAGTRAGERGRARPGVRARDVRGRGRCVHRPRPGFLPPELGSAGLDAQVHEPARRGAC